MDSFRPIKLGVSSSYARVCLIVVIILGLAIGDWLLPLVNLSIGYCLIPVIGYMAGGRKFVAWATIICTALTWSALISPDDTYVRLWVSVVDRVMVTSVLWLTFLLSARQQAAAADLYQNNQALNFAKQELVRSNGELQGFASVVAHDLRGPLAAIGLAAECLKSQPVGGVESDDEDWLSSIQAQIPRMTDLITNLLEYGRAGGAPMRRESCDLASILDRVRENLGADLRATDGEIVAERLPTVQADPILLVRLFQNLVENALKYRSAAPPRITVLAELNGNEWTLRVSDNGKGIDPKEGPTLFEPYVQSNRDRNRSGGVGLGLATCKRIVERHGGKIWAESREMKGSTICFTIPCQFTSEHA